jgi:AraC-like DNA-binding protein
MSDPADNLTISSARASLMRHVLRRAPAGAPQQPPNLPGLMLLRVDQPFPSTCSVYEPCVAIIVQGTKTIQVGEASIRYGEDRYLITSMDLPVKSAVMQASPDRPYLAVALRLDWREIASLMLEAPMPPPSTSIHDGRAMSTGRLTTPLLEAFDRLLSLLDQPEDIPVLAPLIKREIYYRLLLGESGARLRQIATVDSQSHQVARAIASLNKRFSESLSIETLAKDSGMSASTFHHHFKTLTAMSPLQYQKQLRLTEARRLMLSVGMDASTAAFRVGYESPSQFSREYRRLFGAPPSKDIADLRRQKETETA